MVLVEVLVLEGHVAVVDGDSQLAFAEQPLLSQVVIDLIPGLHEMVRLSVTVKILRIVNGTQVQHVLDTLARIPGPLSTNKLRHQRCRVPHHQAGEVPTTNTVLTQS